MGSKNIASVTCLYQLYFYHWHVYHWSSQKKGDIPLVLSFYSINLDFHLTTFFSYYSQKVRRLTLQIENCIRNMNQLNIPIYMSKRFGKQYYLILFSYLVITVMIPIENLSLISYGDRVMKLLIYFYVRRYPFFIWLIADVTFVFWIRQVYRLIYWKTKLIVCRTLTNIKLIIGILRQNLVN